MPASDAAVQPAQAPAPGDTAGQPSGGRVRLRRLELHGFKTFASRAVLEFAPGITAVVGPNGSGKSNVADAVRWVLGEQSLRLLRGRKSEDVIFTGGVGRAPLGMAEVRLTLENAGGRLPMEFGEVELGRRAYRSGESEYYLNRGRVRLRDVVEVLSRAGLGQNGHSVIGQGMVDLALSLRPEERRALFEDAGGQRRFQAKKDEAESKLAEVRANATRVADVIAELEPRLASLKRQARRAEDEARLRRDLREQTEALLAHERWDLERQLAAWQPRAETLAATRADAGRRAAGAQAAADQARTALMEAQQALTRVEGERGALRESLERARRQVAVEQERERGAQRLLADARSAVERLTERVKTAHDAVPVAEGHERQAAEALARARAAAAEAAEALAAHQVPAAPSPGGAPAQDAVAEATRQLTHVTTRLRECERQLTAVGRQQGEADEGQRRTAESAAGTASRLAELDARAARREMERRRLEEAKRLAGEQRSAAEQEVRTLGAELAQIERQIGALETTLKVLREVDGGATAEADIGSKHADRPANSDAGLLERLRRLAEHLEVPPEMEAAVAAAAGPALEWVVVETGEDVAELALRRARDGGERVTFIAQDATAHGVAASPPLPEHEGGLGYLADLLPQPDGPALQRVLLGDSYVVRDLADALALQGRLNGGPRPRIVTLAGETVHSHGAVTAGAPPSEAGALQRRRQIREGAASLAKLRARHTPLAAQLATAQEALKQQSAAERAADTALRDLLQQQSREEGERRGIAQQQARLERDAAWWDEYKGRTAAQLSELQEQVAQLGRQRQTLQEAYEAASARAREAAEAARREQAALVSLRDRAAAARTAVAVAEQQVAQAAQRASLARATSTAAHEELTAARERASKAETESAARAAQGARAAQTVQELEGRVGTLNRQTGEARGRVEAIQGEIERQRRLAEGAREQAAQAERDAALLEAERATLTERLRALHEQAARELGELPPAQRFEGSDAELAARVESVQQRLRALGPVNQVALQEHAEASERIAFLKTQLADLNQSAAALEAAKDELEAGLVADFGRTFTAVAEHFRVYFRRLFGGGDASLTLTDPNDLAESGVEITAQLPGKRRQELALLSGGERALVAAALLFALLKARPSPFCVMDEVDAALDEANVGRFCDVLEELSHQTQFVVITHNRATMERADALYGVTLGEDGVSRIVSLNVREALAGATGGASGAGGTDAAGRTVTQSPHDPVRTN